MFQTIKKIIPSLLYSIVLLALFYWQFNAQYAQIINAFSNEKLSILYSYLFLYYFGLFLVGITTVNLINYLLNRKSFVTVSLMTLLIFYALTLPNFYHIIAYFIHYPLNNHAIMSMVFFIVLTFAYALYSIVILYFRSHIPLSHLIIFVLLSGGYLLYFLQHYGKPLF